MNSDYPIQFPLDTSETDQFRRTLSESYRQALDEILSAASQHQAALINSEHPLPYQVYLLSLILEHHKEVSYLGRQLQDFVDK